MRDADKDREIIARAGYFYENIGALDELAYHYLERAVSAEQRVAELEETLRRMMKILDPHARAYTPAAYAYHEAVKALKGTESEDRP